MTTATKKISSGGLIPYTPTGLDEIHTPGKDMVLGNAKRIIMPGLDWEPFAPAGEKQKRDRVDKMNCVTQSGNNSIETFLNYCRAQVMAGAATEDETDLYHIFDYLDLYNERGDADCSDRFGAKANGTTRAGNTLKAYWDTTRHVGLLPEKDWGWVEEWDEYYRPIPEELLAKARRILEYIEINYEFIANRNQVDALQYGPVQTTVYAWPGAVNGMYPRVSSGLNHATLREGRAGQAHKAFDSYEPFHKTLAPDFNFGWGVLPTFHIIKRVEASNQREINGLRSKGVHYVIRAMANGEVYELAFDGLKKLTRQQIADAGITELDRVKEIIGVDEDFYKKLNDREIRKLHTKGIRYIMRPLANGEVYHITNQGLVKLNRQQIADAGIRKLADGRKIIGIDEAFYRKIQNL